jgi:anti-sigma regulatory factor (Ser/Thr protein kinase)
LIVGDVMGKGIQAAATMGQLRNTLRAVSVERLRPSSALTRLDRLGQEVLESSFATLVYAVLDPESGICRFASAGHPPPVVAHADGRVELLEGGRGLPLGSGLQPRYRQAAVDLAPGSVLLLYSDGLVERRGASIDDGLEALVTAVREAPKDPERLLDVILERVVGSAPRNDDIAVIAARLMPLAPRPLELRLPRTVDSMRVLRDVLRSWLSGADLPHDASEGLVLATWEASANAVEHAVSPADETLLVRATIDDRVVRILVEDSGSWELGEEHPDRGFGLRMMEAMASAVHVVAGDGDRGTRVTIELALDGAHPTARAAR